MTFYFIFFYWFYLVKYILSVYASGFRLIIQNRMCSKFYVSCLEMSQIERKIIFSLLFISVCSWFKIFIFLKHKHILNFLSSELMLKYAEKTQNILSCKAQSNELKFGTNHCYKFQIPRFNRFFTKIYEISQNPSLNKL